MFNKLFNYITGSNSENINIDMTTPVSTKWQNGEVTDGSLIEHEMCFYLNKDHQNNPPKPTSPDVYIVTRPAMTIYTRLGKVFSLSSYLLHFTNKLLKTNVPTF